MRERRKQVGALGQAIEAVAHQGEEQAARLAQGDPAAGAVEQAGAEMLLQRRDLVGDGGLGEAELLRRDPEAQVPGGGLEGAQGGQGREVAAGHNS